MGGVDLSDKTAAVLWTRGLQENKKYWKKLFYLFNLLITNAFILHRKYGENRAMSHHSFLMSIVNALLGNL